MEIELDFWAIVEPLLPLLEEIERIEAMAAGEPMADESTGEEQRDPSPNQQATNGDQSLT